MGAAAPGTMTVVLVGEFDAHERSEWFARCSTVARLDDTVDNEEAGAPLRICTGPREPWPRLWQQMRHLS